MAQGFGFDPPEGYKAYCRFGIKSDFIVVDASVVDSEHMICVSPADFPIPKTTELPLDVPLEIGFAQEGMNVPWTNSDNKFRFYQNPTITSISPPGCDVEDEVEVLLVAKGKSNFFQAITGVTTSGEQDQAHAMVCQFGNYGVTPATYVDPDTIKCMSPRTGLAAVDVGKIGMDIKLSLNSQDFYKAGEFYHYGSDDGWWILMIWLGCITCVITIFALLSCCCYRAFHKSKLAHLDEVSHHDSRNVSQDIGDQDVNNRGGRRGGGDRGAPPAAGNMAAAQESDRNLIAGDVVRSDEDSGNRGGRVDAGAIAGRVEAADRGGHSGPGSRGSRQDAGSRGSRQDADSHGGSNREDHGNGSHHGGSGSHSHSHSSSSSSSSSSSDEE